MSKMFYFMNVDIDWIKQRPHFLAEELAKRFELLVIYPYFYDRSVLNKGTVHNYNYRKFYRVPNRINSKFLHRIVDAFNAFFIRNMVIKEKPDILFLTDPVQVDYIPDNYSGMVIYDCMDDLVALAPNDTVKEKVIFKEKRIFSRADLVTITSNELKNVVSNRYGKDFLKKCILVRNAFGGKIIDTKIYLQNEDLFNICYFGTISTWFDFHLIENSLKINKKIKYTLIGPVVDGVNIPDDERIEYLGVINHDELEKAVENVDCFIMPFVVNDIIKSVDPVKMYEYINYNKKIVTVYYDEIARFEPYVYFYDNEDHFNAVIFNLIDSSPKYTIDERIEFLKSNSWQARCELVVQEISAKDKEKKCK